jgi:hypothetical protein
MEGLFSNGGGSDHNGEVYPLDAGAGFHSVRFAELQKGVTICRR